MALGVVFRNYMTGIMYYIFAKTLSFIYFYHKFKIVRTQSVNVYVPILTLTDIFPIFVVVRRSAS